MSHKLKRAFFAGLLDVYRCLEIVNAVPSPRQENAAFLRR
jgi:hypothetical protein